LANVPSLKISTILPGRSISDWTNWPWYSEIGEQRMMKIVRYVDDAVIISENENNRVAWFRIDSGKV
jgi:hypothetical protein